MSATCKVDDTLTLSDGRQAIIRFVGETSFSDGEWLGIQFSDPVGKNDGSVHGVRYFSCEPGYGMFVRPATVTIASHSPVDKTNAKTGMQPNKGRLSTVALKPNQSVSKSSSSRPSSSSPSSSGITATKPVRRTSTANSSISTRPASTSVSRNPGRLSSITATRPSTNPGAAATSRSQTEHRQSNASILATTSSTTRPRTSILKTSTAAETRTAASATQQIRTRPAPIRKPSGPNRDVSSTSLVKKEGFRPSTESSQPDIERWTAAKQETSELQHEVSRLLAALATAEQGRDHFEKVIQKLQLKYQPMQQEKSELKVLLQEKESMLETREAEKAEFESILEIAALDREMAEERADALERERDDLKRSVEELELELDILSDENDAFTTKISAEERASQGWLALETENERLRAAIIQLRDVTTEDKERLVEDLQSMEEDRDGCVIRLTEAESRLLQIPELEEKLDQCEKDREHLREELEVESAAELVIPNLLEELEHWKDQYDKLVTEFELVEELQSVHQETETTLQADIAQVEAQLLQRDEEINRLEAAVRALEDHTSEQQIVISKFRSLVIDLKYDLESVKASNDITEAEAEELSKRARELMNANQDIQLYRNDSVAQRIQLDLQNLKVDEVTEHFEIARLFVPTAYISESDSIRAYLLFKKLTRQASLLSEWIREKSRAWNSQVQREFGLFALGALDSLSWITDASVSLQEGIFECTVEKFAEYASTLYDLAPVDEVLVEALSSFKMDDPCEDKLHLELLRVGKILAGVCDKFLDGSSLRYGPTRMWYTGCGLKTYIENISSAIQIIQEELRLCTPPQTTSLSLNGSEAEYDQDLVPSDSELISTAKGFANLADKLDALISDSLVAKSLIEKLLRALQEFRARELVLDVNTWAIVCDCRLGSMHLAQEMCMIGENLRNLTHEDNRSQLSHPQEFYNAILAIPSKVEDMNRNSVPFDNVSRALGHITKQLTSLSEAIDFRSVIEFTQLRESPWEAAARQCKQEQLNHSIYENMIQRYQNEARARASTLNERNQQIDEQNLKIEHLEARLVDVHEMHERIACLTADNTEVKTHEADLMSEVNRLSGALEQMNSDHEVYAAEIARRKIEEANVPQKLNSVDGDIPPWESQLESMQATLRGLQTANKFLRSVICQNSTSSHHKSALLSTILPINVLHSTERDSAYYSDTSEESTPLVLTKSDISIATRNIYPWTETDIFKFDTSPENRRGARPGHKLTNLEQKVAEVSIDSKDQSDIGVDLIHFLDTILHSDWKQNKTF